MRGFRLTLIPVAVALSALMPPALMSPALAAQTSEKLFDRVYEELRHGPQYESDVPTGRIELTRNNRDGLLHRYLLLVPESYDPARRYPVSVFLHGGVGRPDPGPGGGWWRNTERVTSEDHIAVIPLSTRESLWWQASQVENLSGILTELKKTYNVDENRVFATGVSDGGTGVYFLSFRDTTPWAGFLPFIGYPGVLLNSRVGADGMMHLANLVNKPLFIVNGETDRLYPVRYMEPFLDASARHLCWGLSLMILGLFQKVVVADGLLAPVVEKVYDSAGVVSPLAAIVGTLAFTGQIFCDFAGYSTIAIGIGMCLGFALPDNFRFPYAAVGFSDFWRRWHISLSTWLRDYLYISLGGNRHGVAKTYGNLIATMLLGGLWHGASWTFVIWGGLHGFYLLLERWAQALFGSWWFWRTWCGQILLSLVTFGMVCLAWVFFRAHTFDKAFEIVQAGLFLLPQREVYVSESEAVLVIFVTGALMTFHWQLRNTSLEQAAEHIPAIARGIILGLMLVLIAVSPGEDRAFIYFQF